MAETLSTLSIISFIISGVGIGLAVFFGILFKIPNVISDLSGRTARKSIAQMREANEKNSSKTHKTNKENTSKGKNDINSSTSKAVSKKKNKEEDRPETGLLAENRETGFDAEATGLLTAQETELLSQETALLGGDDGGNTLETALLVKDMDVSNVTVPLAPTSQKKAKRKNGKKLQILEEVMLIHTHEVIEE